MPSLISSRQIAGHGIAPASACASVVFPEPGGPLTTTSVGRPVPTVTNRPPLSELRRALAGLGRADDLDAVAVGIADEAEPAASFAHLVRRALRLDLELLQTRKRPFEILDADRDVAVPGAELVGATVVV